MNESRLPYPGLRAFDREEADLFFGRDGVVDDMIDRLAETRFLAVLGSSGSGKSSLVKTGLLDGLELGLHPAGSIWKMCEFTPGGRLFGNLATALYDVQAELMEPTPDPLNREHGIAILEGFLRMGPRSLILWAEDGHLPEGGNLLLLVDQFEELFRYGGYSEREEAEAFVKLLIESTADPASPIHCVITMRSDFLGACSLVPGLAEIINNGAFLTPRMSRANCRDAILGPARSVGVEIEEGLVNHLLNELVRFAPWDVDDDVDQVRQLARRADQLPVMQHLLNRLWQRARDRAEGDAICLTLADYEAMGGLNGALDAHGEALLASLDAEDQVLAERIFRNLVNGESPESATRRPLRLDDIVAATNADEQRVKHVLDVFRGDDCNFLRPGVAVGLTSETVVDISHESLIRQWSKLSDWVVDEARSANLWRRLSTAADRYARQEGDLLGGLDLANLSTWWSEEAPEAHWTARYSDNYDDVSTFLAKSNDAQQVRETEKTARDLRERRRLRTGLASVSALAVVASVLAFWAVGAEDRAEDANVAAIMMVQNTNDDLFAAIEDGLTTPVAERNTLIVERSGEIEDIVNRLDDGSQASLMHIRWLSLTASTFLDANWVREAEQRTAELAQLVSDNQALLSQSENRNLYFDALLALARLDIQKNAFGKAEETIQVAERIEFESSDSVLRGLYRDSQIGFLRADMAASENRNASVLTHVDVVRQAYLSAKAHVETNESLTSADTNAMRSIVEKYIRAQVRAVAITHDNLQSVARRDADLKSLVDEVSEALDFYSNYSSQETSRFRSLRSFTDRALSDYNIDVLDDDQSAFTLADQSVDLAAGLVIEDPDNIRYRGLLNDALVQRAKALGALNKLDGAIADLTLARESLFDAKLRRPPNASLRRQDSVLSFYEFYVHNQVGKPTEKRSKFNAARMRAELNFAADRVGARPSLIADNTVFLIWALVNTELASLSDSVDPVEYYQYLLREASTPYEHADDEYVRRRQLSWVYSLLLTLSPNQVGENVWKGWFDDAIENAGGVSEDDEKTLFSIVSLRSMPLALMRRIQPAHALLAKLAVDEFERQETSAGIAAALSVYESTVGEFPKEFTDTNARHAYLRLRNTVSASFFNKEFGEGGSTEWLKSLDREIALNEAFASGDGDTHIIHCWLEGTRAQWYRDNGDAEVAIARYSDALDVCLSPPDGVELSRTTIRNAMVNASQTIKLQSAGNALPVSTAELLHQLIDDVLARTTTKTILSESRSYLSELRRRVGDYDVSDSSISREQIDSYVVALQDLLDATDPGGFDGSRSATGGGVDRQSAGSTNFASRAERDEVRKPITSDFQVLLKASEIDSDAHANWTQNPLYDGSWRTLFGAERDELLDRLLGAEKDTAQYVRVSSLPFYDDGRLVEIERDSVGDAVGVHTVLVFPDSAYVLNGTSPPIHEANAKAPIRLNDAEQVAAYIRFFTTYVNGEFGAFFIVDSGDEIDWWSSAEPEVRANHTRKIRPMAVWPNTEKDRHWSATATVWYSDALFSASLEIQPTGMIAMTDDEPLAANLPVNPIVISQKRSGSSGSGKSAGSVERRVLTAEELGITPTGNFGSEILAVVRALNEGGAEKVRHLLDEYVHLLKDESLLATLNNPASYLNAMAYPLLENETHFEDALALAELGNKRDSETPQYLDTFGWALVKNGRVEDGIEILRQAEEKFTADPANDLTMLEIYVHLGHAYRLNGQNDLALEAIEKALTYEVAGKWYDLALSELDILNR